MLCFKCLLQRFTSLIISRFQSINPKKEGRTENRLADVKAKLWMMTVDNVHFAMWREFIERHHCGEFINRNMRGMYKEKQSFILSTKFQLTCEFFKYFGHFTDADFKVYVQHLLGRTLDQRATNPKVSMHKTILLHVSHHTWHEWVEEEEKAGCFRRACQTSIKLEVH